MTVFTLVEAGAGVALVDPWLRGEKFPTLVRRPFRPTIEVSPRALFLRTQSLSRVAEEFLRVVRARADDYVVAA